MQQAPFRVKGVALSGLCSQPEALGLLIVTRPDLGSLGPACWRGRQRRSGAATVPNSSQSWEVISALFAEQHSGSL